MTHMLRPLFLALAVFLCTTASVSATATDEPVKRFAVLPFAVHGPDQYAYLGQGIQTMLTSRLKWADRFEDLDRSTVSEVMATIPDSPEKIQSALAALKADYLIYGSVTILGDQASLDTHVVDDQGQDNSLSARVPLNDLIPTLENMAGEINHQVFGKPQEQAPAKAQAAPAGPVHPDLVYNEYSPERAPHHLNPEIMYTGATDTPGRWRSQALPFASLGMVVGDADGNGRNEVFILTDNKVLAYHVQDNRLTPLGEYAAPIRFQCLNINMMDIQGDGYQEIIVSAIMDETPRSFILNYIDDKFVVAEDRIPYYLNVVRTPPEYRPTLIGQRKGRTRLFDSEVHEMLRMDGKFDLARSLNLPKGSNVFNFAYLPQENDFKIVIADSNDKLQVFSSDNTFQSVTEESYAGSSLGLEVDESFPGIEQDLDGDMLSYYYIPSRLVPVNLTQDATWNLLANRNISLSAQFFARYRYFPQGEIHALFWDGINLNINWKTRRIRGTVVDYGLADVMNNNKTELFVLVNTHPGATGFTQRRTVLLTYMLELGSDTEEGQVLDIGLD